MGLKMQQNVGFFKIIFWDISYSPLGHFVDFTVEFETCV